MYGSLKTLEIWIPILGYAYPLLLVDIENTAINFLIGLDFLGAEKLMPDIIDRELL